VLAWLNERTDARLGIVTDSLPMIPFLLPPIAGAVGWVLLLSPRAGLMNGVIRGGLDKIGLSLSEGPFDIFTWYGLIFVYMLYQIPYVFLMVSAGLRASDPNLDEQSRVCGASLWRTLRRVTFPATRQSLGAAVLLMMWQGFSLFSVPVIIGTGARIDILSVRIVNLLSFSFPPRTSAAVGLSFIVVLFVGVTWLFQSRLLRSGHHATIGGKGQRAARIELGKWKWPARALVVGYGVVAVVLPIVALVLVSLNGFWTTNIDWSGLGLASFRESVFDDRLTLTAIQNSVTISVVGASIGMLIAAIVSLVVMRQRGRLVQTLDGAIKLPSVFPHLVIAVGFILAFAGPPFNLGGTTIILLLAYISIYLPQGSVAADSAAAQVGHELSEASHVSGAGGGRTFARVFLPLMFPGLVAGWAFLFARMAGDLTATAVLAGTTNMVVGFRILQVFENGSYAQLASLAVVLTAITVAVVTLALVLAQRRGRWRQQTMRVMR
jgi:iron(III) transport system permease protein